MIVDKYGRVAGSIDLAALAEMYAQTDDDDLRAHYREVAAESGVDLEASSEPELPEPDDVPTTGAPEVVDQAPPRGGPGSDRDAWAAYAEANGVEVTDDMTRDEIIAAVEE
jgi:hypothetical protein